MKMRFNKMALACVVVAGSALLGACGGGSDSPPPAPAVATANLTITPSATNGAQVSPSFVSVSQTALVFKDGFSGTVSKTDLTPVPAPAGTTVQFTTGTDASKPVVTLKAGSVTAVGTTTFGSCTFTFDAAYAFAPNKTIYLDPCAIVIPTAGNTADGSSQSESATVTFGTKSMTQTVTVVVSANGAVLMNGTPVGTVTVQNPTGATGGSN